MISVLVVMVLARPPRFCALGWKLSDGLISSGLWPEILNRRLFLLTRWKLVIIIRPASLRGKKESDQRWLLEKIILGWTLSG